MEASGDSRAKMRLTVSGQPLLFEIDTGASVELSLSEETALALGLQPKKDRQIATLASGQHSEILLAQAEVNWLGELVTVEVTVWPSVQVSARLKARKREPAGLIGRGLLRSTRLVIDYVNRRVEIGRSELETD
jgi:predicted aspartyl protease